MMKHGENLWNNMEVSWVIGVPLVIIHLYWIFHYKPSSYWDTSMTMETPIYYPYGSSCTFLVRLGYDFSIDLGGDSRTVPSQTVGMDP